MKHIIKYIIVISFVSFLFSCRKEGCTNPSSINYDSKAKVDDGSCVCAPSSGPTPYILEIPTKFKELLPPPIFPADNPMTVEGVALGKKLFFDKRLSGDNSLSCAGCHFPEFSFVDTAKFSTGIDNIMGDRNAMPIFNAAWNITDKYFWDGRSNGLEEQAFAPVTNPIEMHDTWENVVSKIQSDAVYPGEFKKAFGTSTVDSIMISKALAQYERTLVSGNSRYDKFLRREIGLTSQELAGYNIFNSEIGNCFHCHGDATNPLWTDNIFHNNGLDSIFIDNGLEKVTGNPSDIGKFKTPSLRNLKYTAPYMHDGRFKTIDEVLKFYSQELKFSPTIDVEMITRRLDIIRMTPTQIAELKAFLNTLNDPDFIDKHK